VSEVAGYKVHPAAEVFPLMSAAELAELTADVKANGLIDPILIVNDQILDGRNRALACAAAGIEPRFVQHEGDPWDLTWSKNGTRRDLAPGTKVALRLKWERERDRWDTLRGATRRSANEARSVAQKGRPKNVGDDAVPDVQRAGDETNKTKTKLARAAGVGTATAQQAITLADKAPDLFEKVVAGEMTLNSAYNEAKRAQASEAKPEPLEAPEKLTARQQAARELDAKVRELWDGGALSNAALAERLGCSASTVGNSLARQGLVKRSHPVQTIERKARETAEDLGSAVLSPEVYRDGADAEQIDACIKSLRALTSASKKVINWLSKPLEDEHE
jgi:hypothetical protein